MMTTLLMSAALAVAAGLALVTFASLAAHPPKAVPVRVRAKKRD